MNLYNHTRNLIHSGAVDIDALRVILVGAAYTFAPTETAMTAIEANEVHGNGWPEGGAQIENATASVSSTNASTLTGDNISVTATGGDIGPASGLVIYDATNGTPLFYYNFPTAQTAGDGTPFNINWHADGIHIIGAAA